MASETHELVVKARPEGVEETSEQLSDLSGSFDTAAGEMEESAGLLEGFSDQFRGASGVIIAGLGTLAAGLLAQVPVIGEAVAGVNAIIDSLVLRIDERLRPSVGGLTTQLFAFADSILQATGPLGVAVDFFTVFIATAATLMAGVGALAAAMVGATAAAGALGTTIGAILIPIAAVSAAVAAMAVVWEQNIFGIWDILTGFIEATIEGRWIDAMGILLRGAVSVTTELVAVFDKMKATVQTIFETLGAIVVSALKRLGNMAIDVLEGSVNAAIRAIPEVVRTRLGISEVNLGQPFDPRSLGEIGAAAGTRLRRRFGRIDQQQAVRERGINRQVERVIAALDGATQETTVTLDGREVARNQEQFLAGGTANIGRVNRSR